MNPEAFCVTHSTNDYRPGQPGGTEPTPYAYRVSYCEDGSWMTLGKNWTGPSAEYDAEDAARLLLETDAADAAWMHAYDDGGRHLWSAPVGRRTPVSFAEAEELVCEEVYVAVADLIPAGELEPVTLGGEPVERITATVCRVADQLVGLRLELCLHDDAGQAAFVAPEVVLR